MTRTLLSPGIEINEIDKSSYDAQSKDYSIVNTVVEINGFADFGKDYTTQWINSELTFRTYYGVPTNEPERFFYNAAIEVLNKGGVCLLSKLPYSNPAKDMFNYTVYSVDSDLYDTSLEEISGLLKLDESLTATMLVENTHLAEKMTIDTLDNLKIGKVSNVIGKNRIAIVDVSRLKYDSLDSNCVYSGGWLSCYTNDCLGIVPVIVSPVNAIYFLNYLDSALSGVDISAYNPLSSLQLVKNENVFEDINAILSSSVLKLNSTRYSNSDFTQFYNTVPSNSVSKIATDLFPTINYSTTDDNKTFFDKSFLKSIGIVVFKAYKDSTNSNKLNFEVVESFVGSLDRSSGTDFIDTIVNLQSKYINVFSSIDKLLFDAASIVNIENQTATSLGFYQVDLLKIIKLSDSILLPLNTIFLNIGNTTTQLIDLIVDGGITTLAQLAGQLETTGVDFSTYNRISDFSNFQLRTASDTIYWKSVILKYDEFCKNTRKDCMFIADGIRTFCLEGDYKVVRDTNLNSCPDNALLPKLKYMSGINSSYSAGYCDWFLCLDSYSSIYMWMPPSIKAVGRYLYTDAYCHMWDAPAGLTRGVVQDAIDAAFSLTNEQNGKIYSLSWNYAMNYPMNGIVIEGQKTFLLKNTAFDRVNVRRLFLYLKRQVSNIAKYFIYEGNTEYLRSRFVDSIKPIFERAVNGKGILKYVIKCDSDNNTALTIDNHELHCQIAIQPVKTIEWIVLDFVCTNQGSTVSEITFEE